MSDMREGALPEVCNSSSIQHNLKQIEESLDGQSYLLGEVPQHQLVDPQAFLPLNSDRLVGGSLNAPEKSLAEVAELIEEENNQVQLLHKKISMYAERIEKNRALISVNQGKIKQNNIYLIHDKKNRDYWFGRAEEIELDYQNASAQTTSKSGLG